MEDITKKFESADLDGQSSYANYLSNFSEVVNQLCNSYNKQVGEDNPDELEMLNVFCGMAVSSTQSVEKEMMAIYNELDNDSRNLLNRHVDNSGITRMQRSAISLIANNRKKSKIELIIEIIKKVGLQLIELLQNLFNFPAWLEKILKIIVALLEIIENVLPLILELLGIDNRFMKNAERDLLEFHPMWKKFRTTIVTRTS